KKFPFHHFFRFTDTIILIHGRYESSLFLVRRPTTPPDAKTNPHAAPTPEEKLPVCRHDHPHLRQAPMQTEVYRAGPTGGVRATSAEISTFRSRYYRQLGFTSPRPSRADRHLQPLRRTRHRADHVVHGEGGDQAAGIYGVGPQPRGSLYYRVHGR